MAKSEPKETQLDLRSLKERILRGAFPRIARVLKPYPKDASKADINAAVEELAKQGLVHVGGRSPNLTAKGLELARQLVERSKE
jgi:Mn-dependent DtxR family transcriptional regulator